MSGKKRGIEESSLRNKVLLGRFNCGRLFAGVKAIKKAVPFFSIMALVLMLLFSAIAMGGTLEENIYRNSPVSIAPYGVTQSNILITSALNSTLTRLVQPSEIWVDSPVLWELEVTGIGAPTSYSSSPSRIFYTTPPVTKLSKTDYNESLWQTTIYLHSDFGGTYENVSLYQDVPSMQITSISPISPDESGITNKIVADNRLMLTIPLFKKDAIIIVSGIDSAPVTSTMERETGAGLFRLSTQDGNITEMSIDESLLLSFKLNGLYPGQEADVLVELPFEIPEGIYVYLWKELFGTQFSVPYDFGQARSNLILHLQDGAIDGDLTVNGEITDPLQIYKPTSTPKVEMTSETSAVISYEDIEGSSYDVLPQIEILSRAASLQDVKVVEPGNLPTLPVDKGLFSHNLLKLRLSTEPGAAATIYLRSDSIPQHFRLWEFNPNTAEWQELPYNVYNWTTIAIVIADGGIGDDDATANGIIETNLGISAMAPESELTETEVVQEMAEIGKPVKWIKRINAHNPDDEQLPVSFRVELPPSTENIIVKKGSQQVVGEGMSEAILEEMPKEKIRLVELGTNLQEYELLEAEARQVPVIPGEQEATFLENLQEVMGALIGMPEKGVPEKPSSSGEELGTAEPTPLSEGKKPKDISFEDVLGPHSKQEYSVEYYTEAPQVFEEKTQNGKKLTVFSDTGYTNILTYTTIQETPAEYVKLYWHASREDYAKYILGDESRAENLADETYRIDVTKVPSFAVSLADSNSDGLIDMVEWLTPHLSDQTFEISLVVLNPYTFVRDEETWAVAFNTTGRGNLTISSPNAGWTEFLLDNTGTFDEMEFLELKCGEESLKPVLKLVGFDGTLYEFSALAEQDSVEIEKLLIEDYECDSTGYLSNRMLKAGYASLMFEFSGESATITDYAYDAPVISTVEITSNVSYFSYISSLLGWCNTSNIGDVTYLWKWFRNGQLYSSGDESYTVMSYQENYDSTTSTGTFLSTQPASYLTDGNWNTYARANGAANAIVYENYTMPTGAVNQGTRWQVKDGIGTANLTIPSGCWLNPIQTKAVSYYGNRAARRRGNWSCWDGTAWVSLRYNTDNNLAANMYEDAVWWNLSLATYHAASELINLGNITSGISIGQNWTLECKAYDGIQYSPAVNSTIITITNYVPTLIGPELIPSSADIGSDLQCYATPEDLENSTLIVEWWWYKNGLLNVSGNKTGLISNASSQISSIGKANLTIGDTWNCTIRAFDGLSYSPINSSKVLIQNRQPNITQPIIMPALPNSTSTLRCNVTPGDLENAILSVEWKWYNGSVEKFSGTRAGMARDVNIEISSVGSGNLTRWDVWNCSARSFDGTTYSDWAMTSVLITSEPQPPEVTEISITPELPYISSDLECYATPTDRENSTLAVEWWWYKNGLLNISGNKTGLTRDASSLITTIGSGNLTQGDIWNCSVRTFDGTMYSNLSSAKVQVTNSLPNITGVMISPAVANVTAPLQCNATPGDLESSTLTVEWWWYKNGLLSFSGNKTGLTKNMNSEITVLGAGNLTPGDIWNCTVRTFDGTNYSEQISETRTIINIPPSKPSVSIIPLSANSSSTLRCNVIPNDLENTTLTAEWWWYKNGLLNVSGNTSGLQSGSSSEVSSIGPENLVAGDSWNCTARIFDGLDYSDLNSTKVFIRPGVDIPIASPSFFMTDPAPSGNANRRGFVDSNEFDEWPIELGDYGDTNEKCTLWDCSAWSSSGTNEVGMLCTGGWDCQSYNGYSCQQWGCLGWSPNTRYYVSYPISGWSCGSMDVVICDIWGPAVWQAAPIQTDMYCSGTWNCDSWDGTSCTAWNCSSWSAGTTTQRDNYCSSGWECLSVTGGECDGWSCSNYQQSGTSYADMYCSGALSCEEWTGSTCTSWNCTQWSQHTASYDYSCDQWSCTVFNNMTKACNDWTCLSWVQGTQFRDNYCSGSYSCTAWEDTTNMKPFFTASTFSPEPAFPNSTLSCNITYWDVENSTLAVEWWWYKNGELNSSGTTAGVPRNQSFTVASISNPANFTIGDIWNCTMRAYDGMNYSSNISGGFNISQFIFPVEILINGSIYIDNTTITSIYKGGSLVAEGVGSFIANLTKYELYDIVVHTNLTDRNQTEIRLINLNITEPALSLNQQIITNYTGPKPIGIDNISVIYVLDDTNLVFEKASLSLPKNNLSIDTIGHCTDWDFENFICLNWELNNSADYSPGENSTHIFFNVTSFDGYGAFTKGKDLIVVEMNFSTQTPIEGELVLINVTVYNLGLNPTGTTSTLELNISLYNGTLVPDQSIQKTVPALAGKGGTAVINFNWTAKVGTYIFNATADALNEIAESNETNNYYFTNYTVPAWEILYGKYDYNLSLMGTYVFMDWSTENLEATIYYSDYDSGYNPTDLLPLDGSGYLALADTALGMTYFNDSVSRLYDITGDGMPDNYADIWVAGTEYSVPVIRSTAGSPFITGIMYDSADAASYNGNNDLVFITVLNISQAGMYGTYDYEVKLPSRLSKLKGSINQVTRLDEVR